MKVEVDDVVVVQVDCRQLRQHHDAVDDDCSRHGAGDDSLYQTIRDEVDDVVVQVGSRQL